MRTELKGLYAITPERSPLNRRSDVSDLVELVAQAVQGGARLVQYRDKGPDPTRRRAEALALVTLCCCLGVPLIINDDLELAQSVGAAGVHLGRGDGDTAAARRRLGPGAIIGVSCYDRLDLAHEAQQAGASYVAFGSFYPSPTKPNAARPGIELLRLARRGLDLPLVAIGGITPQNAGRLISAGADLLAVITGVFSAADVTSAARAYSQQFPPEYRPHRGPP